ncbi:hypothetical protein KIPB_005962, partial [Kipferlia bialata]
REREREQLSGCAVALAEDLVFDLLVPSVHPTGLGRVPGSGLRSVAVTVPSVEGIIRRTRQTQRSIEATLPRLTGSIMRVWIVALTRGTEKIGQVFVIDTPPIGRGGAVGLSAVTRALRMGTISGTAVEQISGYPASPAMSTRSVLSASSAGSSSSRSAYGGSLCRILSLCAPENVSVVLCLSASRLSVSETTAALRYLEGVTGSDTYLARGERQRESTMGERERERVTGSDTYLARGGGGERQRESAMGEREGNTYQAGLDREREGGVSYTPKLQPTTSMPSSTYTSPYPSSKERTTGVEREGERARDSERIPVGTPLSQSSAGTVGTVGTMRTPSSHYTSTSMPHNMSHNMSHVASNVGHHVANVASSVQARESALLDRLTEAEEGISLQRRQGEETVEREKARLLEVEEALGRAGLERREGYAEMASLQQALNDAEREREEAIARVTEARAAAMRLEGTSIRLRRARDDYAAVSVELKEVRDVLEPLVKEEEREREKQSQLRAAVTMLEGADGTARHERSLLAEVTAEVESLQNHRHDIAAHLATLKTKLADTKQSADREADRADGELARVRAAESNALYTDEQVAARQRDTTYLKEEVERLEVMRDAARNQVRGVSDELARMHSAAQAARDRLDDIQGEEAALGREKEKQEYGERDVQAKERELRWTLQRIAALEHDSDRDRRERERLERERDDVVHQTAIQSRVYQSIGHGMGRGDL